jgi:hypothetical protein
MIAIDGKGFCCAAFQAFSLILRNILRVAAVDFVSMFVMFLGKLAITGTPDPSNTCLQPLCSLGHGLYSRWKRMNSA